MHSRNSGPMVHWLYFLVVFLLDYWCQSSCICWFLATFTALKGTHPYIFIRIVEKHSKCLMNVVQTRFKKMFLTFIPKHTKPCLIENFRL